MRILVTGSAGFIGFHVVERLLDRGDEVIGLDNINDYYDVRVKYGRLAQAGIDPAEIAYGQAVQSRCHARYRFVKLDLEDRSAIESLFAETNFDRVCHLAAQAGVRYSLTNPHAYMSANIVGFMHILEGCRHNGVTHLTYASSSSVYGMNKTMPFSTQANVDHPVSLYAASKKANELMAHCYSHLYDLPSTGLRFFTVYGPWGRPDMALFLFTQAILDDRPIDLFNYGDMQRDFTYVDDIVEGVIRVLDHPPAGDPDWSEAQADPSRSSAPYKIYNIGNSTPVRLLDFVEAIEQAVGKQAKKNLMPMQPGDVPATWADVSDLVENLAYQPNTSVTDGVARFVAWYRDFYQI